jgi:RHS repeat-associated protein
MTTTKAYDNLNRLTSIQSSAGGSPVASFGYSYNAANQRTTISNADDSRWVYQYDSLGQVISGKKYWADGTPVAGQQFEYGFDDIGNRTSTKAGGDQSGAGLRLANYGANSLNQYSSRTVPGAVDILGSATNTTTVTVNNLATYRKGDYFRDELSADNSSAPVWLGVTSLAVLNDGSNPDIVATNIGNAFVPKTPETFGYDADGNTTNDGRWIFTWDAENRLASMQALSSVPSGAKKKLDFAYDYRGRRIQKIVSTWDGTAYVAASTNKFVYDGWNLVAELNGTNGLIRSYVWGVDLSGSMQGAGGVGGLLAIKPASGNPSFVAYDGNGNVTGLVDATTGTTSGQIEYGPFGETIRLTPNVNNQSPFRFSTKYTDDESDFLYYGFRYYNPSTGRWLSRDPIAERGGLNLYGLVNNGPINRIDRLGLFTVFGYTFMWGNPTWMDPQGAVHTDTPPSEIPPPTTPITYGGLRDQMLGDDGVGGFFNFAQGLHDSAISVMEATPINSFSEIALGESLGGKTVGVGGRIKCAAMSGPALIYIAGKGIKISRPLFELLKGKSAKEIEEVLKKQCCVKDGGVIPDLGRKLEFMLGNATGNQHNIDRSAELAGQLQRIGLPDTADTRQLLNGHLSDVLNDAANIVGIQENGRVVRESLLMGPLGGAKVQTIWEGNKLITVNIFGGWK